jgi:hypothetical protein
MSEPLMYYGTWAKDDPRRIFVEGAAWWEWTKTGGTMWAADRDTAEVEARKRFPNVQDESPAWRSEREP